MLTEQQTNIINQLFYSDYIERRDDFLANPNPRFVYYTSADTAVKIIKNSEVWLRSATLMNDFSEIFHGQDCLSYCWHQTPSGKRLKAVMGILDVDAEEDFAKVYDEDRIDQRMNSYMICISEHANAPWNEDAYGRLSMWRAYGGDTNVALVMNSAPFFVETEGLGAYTSPVFYADREHFATRFATFVDGLTDNIDFLRSLGWEVVRDYLFHKIRTSVLSTKHPGFAEEREWRVIYSPKLFEQGSITKNIESVGGVPQVVYKLPLKDIPEMGVTGIEVKSLIDRVLIGPSPYASDISHALAETLTSAGVEEPWSKLVNSSIPLRR